MTTRILLGHVLDVLKTMEDESVHCVITSPPYYGLRSYGTEPQIWGGRPDCEHVWKPLGKKGGPAAKQGINSHLRGRSVPEQQTKAAHADQGECCERCLAWRGEHGQEPTFDLWLQHEVLIFREIKRVLRKDGTLWLNIGDAYATTPNGRSAEDQKAAGTDNRTFRNKPNSTIGGKFKPKDRLLMPHRLAIALHEDGWWVRDEIVWSKLNSMPSSIKDRTCPSHEFMFMLTKRPHYYYDYVAIQEPLAEATINDRVDGDRFRPDRGHPSEQPSAGNGRLVDNGMKIKRSVWSLALEPFPEAHFATFPTKLIVPAIEAGTSAHGVCPKCGAPWERQTVEIFTPQQDAPNSSKRKPGQTAPETRWNTGQGSERGTVEYRTAGWAPTCKHAHLKPVPATVLDPFGGSGTTGLVADMLGRDAILIELNPEYAQMARKRIRENLGRVQSDIPEDKPADLPLFQSAAE
jgi:DNA modification methylase